MKEEENIIIIISIVVIRVLVIFAPLLYFFGEIFIEMIFYKPSEPIQNNFK